MSLTCSEVRRGAYFDSVVLMQLQRALAELPGVEDAGVVMATAANLDLLAASDLLTDEARGAGADDLLIAVRAEDELQATAALEQVDALLKQRRSRASRSFQPRSLPSAIKTLPQADWVLISVPGRYAAGVAREALEHGKHTFLYSDNVDMKDEIELKDLAHEKGLLLMGPDCGTAIINGVGLGFANRTRRGSIGLVAASGTGLQAISSYIHNQGAGISQAIGTGGRDLSPEVGGMTSMQAMDLLGRDPQTKAIVLVSKPPAAKVATRVLAAARAVDKPVVVYFMGQPVTARRIGNVLFAINLLDAAELAVGVVGNGEPEVEQGSSFADLASKCVRGLFSGGTLAYEVMLGLQNQISPMFSNVPLREEQRLANPLRSQGHAILDLGADEFTQGRLHPMMDNTLRLRRLRQEAADPDVGLIVLDVVLGEGAHADPASELAPVVTEVIGDHDVDVAIFLVGTEDDPQDLARQKKQLEKAGARLFDSTVDLVAAIAKSAAPNSGTGKMPAVSLETFRQPLAAINVGLESFYDSLTSQEVEAVHVSWRPPAGGNEKMMALLAKLKSS